MSEKKLYRVTMRAYKTFFVEADVKDKLDIMDLPDVRSEERTVGGKFDWEYDYDPTIIEMSPDGAAATRRGNPGRILRC